MIAATSKARLTAIAQRAIAALSGLAVLGLSAQTFMGDLSAGPYAVGMVIIFLLSLPSPPARTETGRDSKEFLRDWREIHSLQQKLEAQA